MPRLPLIAFAPNPWVDYQWMNRQQLLSRFAARGWDIAYSTGALDIWNRGTSAWAPAPRLGTAVPVDGVLVDQPGRLLPRWRKSRIWDRLALTAHARRLKQAAGVSGRSGIALLFHPSFWPYVEVLRPRYVAYHVYDVYSRQGNWSPELAWMEMALIQRADIITASSDAMVDALPGLGASKGRVLPNGADAQTFLRALDEPCPSDLADIPHPRISYIGSINRKVDLEAVAFTAKERPDWQWVLIGLVEEAALNADPGLKAALAMCRNLPNVHILGPRPKDSIPAYAAHMDVNTMCYRVRPGEWARSGYPLKLHEYLAVGKPVVSAPISVVQDSFSAVVDIAHSNAEWLKTLETVLAGGGTASPEIRQSIALENSWDRRVDILEHWYREMIRGVQTSAISPISTISPMPP